MNLASDPLVLRSRLRTLCAEIDGVLAFSLQAEVITIFVTKPCSAALLPNSFEGFITKIVII